MPRKPFCFNPRPASGAKEKGRGRSDLRLRFQSAPRERGESLYETPDKTLALFQSAPRERGESSHIF